MNGILFPALKDWRLVIIFFYIIPAFLILLSAIFILQKTPIDLLQSETP